MIRRLLGGCLGAVVVTAWACGGSSEPSSPPAVDGSIDDHPPVAQPDAGTRPDGGTDAGPEPDAGTDPEPDAGTGPEPDAGTDPEPDGGSGPTAGPWPTDAVMDYSARYNIDRAQAVGVDAAHNIWLLDGDRIGVLRADTQALVWTRSPIGQARDGFGPDRAATGSTVICGGSAGRAYVGYATPDLREDPEFEGLQPNYIVSPDECYQPDPRRPCYPYSRRRLDYYKQGDVDVVRLNERGEIVLEEHLHQSIRNTVDENGQPRVQTGPRELADVRNLGIRNSNDHHFDEDRSILSCVTVLHGRDQGDVYVGTNHGVTRIRGLEYNSHRHPIWHDENGSQKAGYTYGLGIAQDGDVLIANQWTFGIVTPTARLGDWDNMDKNVNRMKVESSYLPQVNSLAEYDSWRGFQQTTDGRYYLGSADLGLWEMTIVWPSNQAQTGTQVTGANAEQRAALQNINALAATGDGSLFIGTNKGGLWRLTPQKALEKVTDVSGSKVKQLIYDPRVTPAALYVLTDRGLTVLRGH
ncbi:hypothetical protein [Myxococcus sp. Y35]|uniref:hypothetical protein n=1 Tax=Pseudomyxococcus flavus TaxID=3115648 RepID=UPI003CEC0272